MQVIIKIWVNGIEGKNIEGLGALFGGILSTHETEGIRLPAMIPQPVDCCSNLSSKVFAYNIIKYAEHVNTLASYVIYSLRII